MVRAIHNRETPFKLEISFHKYLDFLEETRGEADTNSPNAYAESLLQNAEKFRELREGISDVSFIRENEVFLKQLLANLFPPALTRNEIKAVTLPFSNITFNFTQRFRNILSDAGRDFELDLRNISDSEFYIYNCCLILHSYFGKNIALTLPFYYDIPDKNGVLRHYRITINADFTEIIPTEKAKILTDDDIAELLNNFDDLKLWKKKFPPQSWILKGFSIISLTDATSEVALSDIKSLLLNLNPDNIEGDENLVGFFKSYFEVADLKLGMMLFNDKNFELETVTLYEKFLSNDILNFWRDFAPEKEVREAFMNNLRYNSAPIVVTDTVTVDTNLKKHPSYQNLVQHGIRSCMIIPIVANSQLLAMMELSSATPNALNGMKLKKVELILPYFINTFLRFRNEKSNQIEAIIQREYTTLHPSVAWKFEEQAERFFNAMMVGETYTLKEISFKNLVPLFGQTDIKSSSQKRNECLKADLAEQVSAINEIIETNKIPESEKLLLALTEVQEELNSGVKADTKDRFQYLLQTEIHPLFIEIENSEPVKRYFENLHVKDRMFYRNQRRLDSSIRLINRSLANFLDSEQKEAQAIFPHYFDRFKSDGVEHNLFVGQSIAPKLNFDEIIIEKLRFWQLATIVKMEHHYAKLKPELPYELEVASLILVYNDRLDIRFRMDEKRFDVDGAYNTRYEIIKKRLEKAMIKGTAQRLTKPGRIAIVHYSEEDKRQYMQFISILQDKNLIKTGIEEVELEDLPGISGLRALRVKI